MNRYLLSLVAMFLFAAGLSAQGSIKINEDGLIPDIMERFVEKNKAQSTLKGWRVQILSTRDRAEMDKTLKTFKYLYPNLVTIFRHEKPYYKILVGAFMTRLEAVRLKYILQRDYDHLYLAEDPRIRPEEIVGYY